MVACYSLGLGTDGQVYAGAGFFQSGVPTSYPHLARLVTGGWSYLPGLYGATLAISRRSAGGIHLGTSIGAVSWDGDSAWSVPGGGTEASVLTVKETPDGMLYAGGDFTLAGGHFVSHLGRWDGTRWWRLDNAMPGTVRALAVDGAGLLYAGGDFPSADLGGAGRHVARWDGAQWTGLGSGVGGNVRALAFDGAGRLYAGGDFLEAGGSAASHIAMWDGTAWHALGAGVDGAVNALVIDHQGNLIVGGEFLHAGGLSASRVARWNGSQWSALGSGVDNSVLALAADALGAVYVGGRFGHAGDLAVHAFAVWKNAQWSDGFDPSTLDVDPGLLPRKSALLSITPNPFRLQTRVRFEIAARARVVLEVFDMQGRLVQRPVDGRELESGTHAVDIAGLTQGAGLYFLRLRAGAFEATGRFIRLD